MHSTNERERTHPAILWGVLLLVSALLLLVSAEVLVRLVPGQWSSAFFFRHDPILGAWHIENFRGNNVQRDFNVRGISTNSFGMRDRARVLEKTPGVTRIAVLGDSFVEGLQVRDEEVFTRLMEARSDRIEVLNFGVAGFGTTQEYLTYFEHVRQFKPDIVILGFLSSNDMRNNSRALEALYNGAERELPFLERNESGAWALTPVPEKPVAQNPVTLFVKRHFTLYRFLWFQRQKFLAADTVSSGETAQNPHAYIARLFSDPTGQDAVFNDAWRATEELIRRLRDAVESDGARFILVTLPDATHIEPHARAVLEKEYGEKLHASFDIDYPEYRLAKFAQRENIAFFDLTPIFRAYRDAHDLPWPYFSFAHDGHWSPLGHRVAADALLSHLQEAKYVEL